MKRILLLGATGMLGSAVYDVLKDKYKLILAVRNPEKIKALEDAYGKSENAKAVEFDAEEIYKEYEGKKAQPSQYLENFFKEVGDFDYAINAAGVTIPFSMENPSITFFINSALPHILANEMGEKLIHITTDCAFSGLKDYPYNENSIKSPTDIYGLSKSLGEPENCLTLRTSIIGLELSGKTGLLEWFLKQDNEISGYSNHFWNGITTREFGKVCDRIMSEPEKYPKKGIYHIFSNKVSKYEMLLAFKKRFNKEIEIKENPEPKLNRVMSTAKDLNTKLEIPSFEQMLDEIKGI
ncbi:MAG: sugar nucleotide-binding protein [bacterium]|nr:sugar nucleotide-binding protein [bacterium]